MSEQRSLARTFEIGPIRNPRLLTPEIEERFFVTIKALGPQISVAADRCGLEPRTVRRWIERGEGVEFKVDRHDGRGLQILPRRLVYIRFARLYRQAIAEWRVLVGGNVTARTRYDAQAGMELLDAMGSEEWKAARRAAKEGFPPENGGGLTVIEGGQTNNVLLMDPEVARDIGHAMLAQLRDERAHSEPDLEPIVITRPPDNGRSRALRDGLREDG